MPEAGSLITGLWVYILKLFIYCVLNIANTEWSLCEAQWASFLFLLQAQVFEQGNK